MKWNHTKFNSIITIIIAVLTLFLLLINQINGSPVASSSSLEIVAAATVESSSDDLIFTTNDSEGEDEIITTTPTTTMSTTTTHVPYVRGKNKKIVRKQPEEPPEKTWKALQICGIITFFVIVLYYIKKITKKFERNHEDDHL